MVTVSSVPHSGMSVLQGSLPAPLGAVALRDKGRRGQWRLATSPGEMPLVMNRLYLDLSGPQHSHLALGQVRPHCALRCSAEHHGSDLPNFTAKQLCRRPVAWYMCACGMA